MEIDRQTFHLFDYTIKHEIEHVGFPLVVAFVNGVFKTHYDPSSRVTFWQTEGIHTQEDRLERRQSDMLLAIGDDDFEIEFQLGYDTTMGLRIFEYGLDHARTTRGISPKGEQTDLKLPTGGVVVWESTGTLPAYLVVRLAARTAALAYQIPVFNMAEQSLAELEAQDLLILVPFCLLRFRRRLKQEGITEADRSHIAIEAKGMLEEIEGILHRSLKRGTANRGDGIIILDATARMYKELYGTYPEFKGAYMALQERIEFTWSARELEWREREKRLIAQEQQVVQEAVQQAVQQAENKILGLLEQGYTLEQVKKQLAQEDRNSNASSGTPQ